MKYRTRTYYTDAQKALMWERWKQGWTLHQIAHLFDRAHGSIRGIFERTGAFRPQQRSRSPIALTLAEREEISRSVAEGRSIRSTAARLGRAPSTVSREVRRNGGQADYRASDADRAAWERALRPKCCKLANNRALALLVTDKLRLLWSPEQIAGWLAHAHPHDQIHRVSHETIYRTLFIQARGALKKELVQHLRRTRAMHRSRHHTQKTDIHGRIVGAVSIRERPASAEDRAMPAHWEGDLMFGAHNSQIATLVERQTRYVMLAKVASKDTETLVDALIKNARKLPQELYRSHDETRVDLAPSRTVHATADHGTQIGQKRCVAVAQPLEQPGRPFGAPRAWGRAARRADAARTRRACRPVPTRSPIDPPSPRSSGTRAARSWIRSARCRISGPRPAVSCEPSRAPLRPRTPPS
jgi:IS30 family transposase